MLEWQDTVSTWVLSYAPRAAMGTARAITVSDLVACLKANPEVRDTVLRELAPRKARAETAERDLAALHALIHDQSGLDDHKYTPGQMVAEMAARWQGASDDCDRFERERDEAQAERDTLRAACQEFQRREEEYERESFATLQTALREVTAERNALRSALTDSQQAIVGSMRARIAKLEAVAEAARELYEAAYLVDFTTDPERYSKLGRARIAAEGALRALDAQDPPGSSSGLPDAADAPQATDRPEQRNESPQDALSHGGARGPFSSEDRARIAKLEAVVEAARRQRKWIDYRCRSDGSEDDRARGYLDALGALRHWFDEQLRALDAQDSGGSGAASSDAASPVPGMPPFGGEHPGGGDTTPGDTRPPEPAGSSQDPLAALKAAVARPLTAEDRQRIEAARAKLRTGTPRGGLLPEPWERGRRGDYVTRAEMVGACRAAVERYKEGAYLHELAALASELRKGQ